MKSRIFAPLIVVALLLAPPAKSAPRENFDAVIADYLKKHPDEIGAIMKDYFLGHPEVFREMMTEMSRRQALSPGEAFQKTNGLAEERAVKIAANAAALFNSPHQVTLGDPNGDVTLVEFFDYNCGYCKRALTDTLSLLDSDPHLRLALKEFPILGPRSVDAAQVAIAARMQDPQGAKYLAFHRELLGLQSMLTQDAALAAARDQGFDMDRLQRDMNSEEVAATLKENTALASALRIAGTPTYIAGDKVLIGAVGLDALKAQIAALRLHGANVR